jgi:predicted nuclease of predicted toxin-antitoxin system
VKFLIDNQLPPALAVFLRQKGFDCQHVLDVGLADAADSELCDYATDESRVIISKDEDFLYLVNRPKAKFQFIWVRLGNCRTNELLKAFEQALSQLEIAANAGERVVELR